MEKPTHYIEIRVLPLDGEMLSSGDIGHVTAKIMAAVHLHRVEGHEVAVAFPRLCTKSRSSKDGSLAETIGTGSIIRIFGDIGALMGFLVRPDFAFLIGAGACSVGSRPVKDVPANVEWMVYSRDRSCERRTPAYIERTSRRLLRRIQDGRSAMTEATVAERAAVLEAKVTETTPPYINVKSASTGKQFRLFIISTVASGFNEAQPDFYGLGAVVPSF